MRRIILASIGLLFSTSLSAQYSRSLYPTFQPGVPRSATIAVMNSENYFLSIKESENDSIKVLTGRIDSFGESDNYQQYLLTNLPFSNVAVSGMGSDNNGNLVCAVIRNNFGIGYLHYFRIDPINGALSVPFTLPFDLEGPFGTSRVKGDSLVTYITQEGAGLIRVAASLNNPSNYSYRVVDAAITITGSLTGGARHLEFKLDPAGAEYVVTGGNLYKRNTFGNFQVAALTNFLPQEFSGITMAVNANGEVMVMNPQKYEFFNSSLLSVGAGMNNLNLNLGSRFFELHHDGASWNFFAQNTDQTLEQITFTNSVLVSDRNDISATTAAHAILDIQGIPYLMTERKTSALGFFNGLSLVGISQLNTQVMKPFVEFNQEMQHDQLAIGIAHMGTKFMGESLNPGIRYTHNNTERVVMFYSTSMIVGKEANGELYTDYTGLGRMENIPGPYSPNSTDDLELIDRYSRGYYVSREMIDAHITMVTNGNPSYEIPFGIREWPAHGDPALGQTADLAPFVDQNNNGIYEPQLGDYPSIYGSQCVLLMYHSNPTYCDAGLEFYEYFYTVDCDTSETLNSTVFMTKRIFARADDFTDAYLSEFTDGDIGNPFDDYFGTNVELGMTYVYNADLNDESSGGSVGFNDTIPAVGYQILKGVKIADDGLDNAGSGGFPVNAYGLNDGTVDNEYSTMASSLRGVPSTSWPTAATFYNIVQGNFADGTPNSVNGVDIRYDYFGESDPAFYASGGLNHGNLHYEFITNNASGDRNIWGNSAQFDLDPSSYVEFTSAYITAIDTMQATNAVLTPVKRLFALGTILKDMYGTNIAGCELGFDPYVSDVTLGLQDAEELPEITVYPNPTNGDLFVRTDVSETCQWQLIDIQGNVLQSGELNGQTKIAMLEYSAGIYLLQIKTGSQGTIKRVVKY